MKVNEVNIRLIATIFLEPKSGVDLRNFLYEAENVLYDKT